MKPPDGGRSLLLFAARTSPSALRVLSRLLGSTEFAAYNGSRWEQEHAAGSWDWLRSPHEAIHQHVVACYCKHLRTDPAILDVGCGEGLLNELLRHSRYASYTGIDIAPAAIAKAARLADGRTRFLAADADRFATADRFDIIVFNETLYYFPDPAATLRHMGGMLQDDGVFVVSMALGGMRDRLLKLRIWHELEQEHAVVDELWLHGAASPDRTIKILSPRGLAAPRARR